MSQAEEDVLEIYIREQNDQGGLILRFTVNLNKTAKKNQSLDFLEARKDLLEEYWSCFLNNHRAIVRDADAACSSYVTQCFYDKVEAAYLEAITDIKKKLRPFLASSLPVPVAEYQSSHAASSASSSQFHLPKFQIPNFSGDVLEWESFRDQFQGILSRTPGLTNVHKLLLLQQHLEGDAKEMLKNTPVLDASYPGAWSDLEKRYGNTRLLCTHHMLNVLSVPNMSSQVSSEIKRVLDRFRQTVRSFEALDKPIEHWNDWLVFLLLERLDSESRLKWETSQEDNDSFPAFSELCNFLEKLARALDSVGNQVATVKGSEERGKTSGKHEASQVSQSKNLSHVVSSKFSKDKTRSFVCELCSKNHSLDYCPKFIELEGKNRFLEAKRLKVCYNCLKGHYPSPCPSKFVCRSCQGNHHSLLHDCFSVQGKCNVATQQDVQQSDLGPDSLGFGSSISRENSEAKTSNVAATITTNKVILLATAKVRVFSANGKSILLRALIDTGSDTSLISEWAVQSLGLYRAATNTVISGVQGATGRARSAVEFIVRPSFNDGYSLCVSAFVLEKVASLIPSRSSTVTSWPHLDNLTLADPDFFLSSKIDLILGADVCGLFFSGKTVVGPLGSPSAHETPFGYVLMGPTSGKQFSNEKTVCVVSSVTSAVDNHSNLLFDFRKFWEVEELGQNSLLSPEEEQCEKFFQETHARKPSGRYVVRLPFSHDDSIVLGSSRNIAVSMLHSMERKMEKNSIFAQKYRDNINDFLAMGHMLEVPFCKLYRQCNYLPHHGVFKTHDPLEKLRVVFNAAQKTGTGFSLNSKLLPGPKLQSDLWVVLTKWRFFKIVFMTDIVKMFRQIAVHQEDWDWQRIVWRNNPNEPVKDFWVTVVMFGEACAPYLALRCKEQLVKDEGHRFPLGAVSLTERSYVDDIFEGADTEELALETKNQLIGLLEAGGFPLSKWSSNCSSLADSSGDLPIKESDCVSALGVVWSPSSDLFRLKVDISAAASECFSKRILLSEISKLFDPLGWFSPVLIVAKILIQDLWLLNLEWDDQLPSSVCKTWKVFRAELPLLSNISLPRWIGASEDSELQFHCFADASERAYAAVIYVVAIHGNSRLSTLLVSKTKVAPIKKLSIPRLELCAAALLVRLAVKLIPQLHLKNKNIKVFAWSDSSVVLTWLNSHPFRWKPFVAHRVAEIQNASLAIAWRYVPTKCNPADVATRSISAGEFKSFSLWWKGPEWLEGPRDQWPDNFVLSEESKVVQEMKASALVHVVSVVEECDLFKRYSNLSTLIKVVAYVLRFVQKNNCGDSLLPSELENSLCFLTRVSQKISFPKEYAALKEKKKIFKSSPLLCFRPFLDESGCIRVGGRLSRSYLSYNEKYPFLISKSTAFSRILVQQAHLRCLHGGQEMTRNCLLQRFWILHGRSYIRSVLRNCVICAKYHARTAEQLMGQLPAERLKPEKPFLRSGVDYAGPFVMKASSGRGIKTIKGYLCLFVCMTTKAVHLELVTSLSTSSFISAFDRFISRRGQCLQLFSDNGTNFRGAATELSEKFKKGSEFYRQVSHAVVAQGTSWTFIPPSSPHFGGLWEAGVKSVKSHLKKVIGEQKLTYEEMFTFLCKVEACLNSRPLYDGSSDPNDLLPLTPAHFLTGGPIIAYPEVPMDIKSTNTPADKFKLVTKMRDSFWQRWSTEYVQQLQQLHRWRSPSNNIQVGNLVLIKDNQLPATRWPLARVLNVISGPDNLIRVADVQSATGVYRRPIVKLVLLPIAPIGEND